MNIIIFALMGIFLLTDDSDGDSPVIINTSKTPTMAEPSNKTKENHHALNEKSHENRVDCSRCYGNSQSCAANKKYCRIKPR